MIIIVFTGVVKLKRAQRKRVEELVIKEISDDEIEIIDYNKLNNDLKEIKSDLDFEGIIKSFQIEGHYILDGSVFIKKEKVDKVLNEILHEVQKIYDNNLSKQDKAKLIKVKIEDLAKQGN